MGLIQHTNLPLIQFVLTTTTANTDKHLKAMETKCFYTRINALFKQPYEVTIFIIFFKGGDIDPLGSNCLSIRSLQALPQFPFWRTLSGPRHPEFPLRDVDIQREAASRV